VFSDRTTVAALFPCTLTLPSGQTCTARVVSAQAVRSLTEALRTGQSDIDRVLAMVRFLRHAFPWRWWYRFGRDPVRQISTLPLPLLQKVLSALFFVPGSGEDERDPVASEIARQRAIARPGAKHALRGPSLSLAILTCEARMGAGWYRDAARWGTSDGCAPFAVVWLTYEGLQALDARERLNMMQAIELAIMDGEDKRRAHDKTVQHAYPRDPLTTH